MKKAWLAIDCSLVSPAWIFYMGHQPTTDQCAELRLYACPQELHQQKKHFQYSKPCSLLYDWGVPLITPKRTPKKNKRCKQEIVPSQPVVLSEQQKHDLALLETMWSSCSSSSANSSCTSSIPSLHKKATPSAPTKKRGRPIETEKKEKKEKKKTRCIWTGVSESPSRKQQMNIGLHMVSLPIVSVSREEQKNVSTRIARYQRIVAAISDTIDQVIQSGYVLQEVYIEGYAMNISPGQASMASLLYELGGILRSHLISTYKIKITELSPTLVKKHWTGRGDATKQDMFQSFIMRHLCDDFVWCLHANETIYRKKWETDIQSVQTYKPIEDIIDAWAVLHCGLGTVGVRP